MREWIKILEDTDYEIGTYDTSGHTYFFARDRDEQGRKRTVASGVFQRIGDDEATIHGTVKDGYKASGLFRRFWRKAQELAQAEGRTLVQPDEFTDDGAKAWRGRNFFGGAKASTNESLFTDFLMEAARLIEDHHGDR